MINDKTLKMLFRDVKRCRSALFLGQRYFTCDSEFFEDVKRAVNTEGGSQSELYKECKKNSKLKELGEAIERAGQNADRSRELRFILAMGWNIAVTSCVNIEWFKSAIGDNFPISFPDIDEQDHIDVKNKNALKLWPIYGSEAKLNEINVLQITRADKFRGPIYYEIIAKQGYLVVDGIETDDWHSLDRFLNGIDDKCWDQIFIFGLDEEKLDDYVEKDEDRELFQEYLQSGQIAADKRSFAEALTDMGFLGEDEEDEETQQSASVVRATLQDGKQLLLDRDEITELRRMGITVLADELFIPRTIEESRLEQELANFLCVRDNRSWSYFNMTCGRKPVSFHVNRNCETTLRGKVNYWVRKQGSDIVLLYGDSNSGKTTSLSFLAHEIYSGGNDKKKKNNAVIFISGDPSLCAPDWAERFVDFLKKITFITEKNLGKCIVIWDNYNGSNKIQDYRELNEKLAESAVLIGSAYSYEVPRGNTSNSGFDIVGISSTLDKEKERGFFKDVFGRFSDLNVNDLSGNPRLFRMLVRVARSKYSPEWQQVKFYLNSNFDAEKISTETAALQAFSDKLKDIKSKKNNTVNDAAVLEDLVLRLGIGAGVQAKVAADAEKARKNEALLNAICDMNVILAVASQFKKNVTLPFGLLLSAVISESGQNLSAVRSFSSKLRRVLEYDSMARCDMAGFSGDMKVSFRDPFEAYRYLLNMFPDKQLRMDAVKDVVIRLMDSCDWNSYDESKAVIDLLRNLGTNSYGHIEDAEDTEDENSRGNFTYYQDIWTELIKVMGDYSRSNDELALVRAHFTRELIARAGREEDEGICAEKKLPSLDDVCEDLRIILDLTGKNSFDTARTMRLSGEVCRNLIEQRKAGLNDSIDEDFEHYFKTAVTVLRQNEKSFDKMLFTLDIWLIYVIDLRDRDRELYFQKMPATLSYIDMLFYSNFYDAVPSEEMTSEDYSNLIKKIKTINSDLGDENDTKMEELFTTLGNDSYLYYKAKRLLYSAYEEYMKEHENSEVSVKVFFLSEFASRYLKGEQLNEVKALLHKKAKEIVKLIDEEYKKMPNPIDAMSERICRLYFKAKWMDHTGSFLMEEFQKPAIDSRQWKEMGKLALRILDFQDFNVNAVWNRAAAFIYSVSSYLYPDSPCGEKNKLFFKQGSDPEECILCFCDEHGKPRRFTITTNGRNTNNKVYCNIKNELVDGSKKQIQSGNKYTHIFVPRTVNGYWELVTANTEHTAKGNGYTLWFDFRGPLVKDSTEVEENELE